MEVIIIALVVAVAVVIILAARQPDEFRVTRSAVFNAPPALVFEQVNDLEKWQAWSPWVRMEPDAKSVFEGPKAGKDAKMSWEGKKTGQGAMTITESRASEFVQFRLEFFKPMKAVNTAEFNFTPENTKTHVTWTMYGPNNFIGKCVGLFMNCEKMVGGQFEEGLGYLREVVETPPRKAA